MEPGVLNGLRVLDLTHVVAGPYASMYLAMLGAEVIKIENPKTAGDLSRKTDSRASANIRFCTLNHNKSGIALDLSQPEGKKLFLQLVEKSDIVMENFRPGVMDRLGVGYEVMKSVNPKIIYGSISGFGSYGPYAKRPAFDIIAQAMSGVMMLNGSEGDPPVKVGTSLADVLAGVHLVVGILAALHRVRETGEGCRLETSLVDALVSTLLMEHVKYFHTGAVPPRLGNNYREWCPFGAYLAKDGWFVLAIGKNSDFFRLAALIGRSDMAENPEFATHPDRVRNINAVTEAISAWGTQYTVQEVCQILMDADIPCGPVNGVPEMAADPHIRDARKMFPQYEQPGVGTLTATNIPVRFHGMEPIAPTAAPEMGQQTAEILHNLLGLDEDTLTALQNAGVILS